MNGGIPSRGLLNVGNIPVELKVKVGQGIEPYSIIPLLNGEVHGSGTLVTIDGVRGILTAGHVGTLQHWATDTQGVSASCPSGAHQISSKSRWSILTALSSNKENLRSLGQTWHLFWDLTRSGSMSRQVFIIETSPIASCGVVAERTERSSDRITLNQYVLLGSAPQLFEREGYDYVDLRSRRSLEPKTPTSFGGMSGSGLWRFSIAKVSGSVLKPFDFQLAGVAFYQLPDTGDGIATVRFHGPRSIYERLLPSVRNWLAKK